MRILFFLIPTILAAAAPGVKSTSDRLPRKVIVGTAIQTFPRGFPGLENRLEQLTGMVDRMAAEARKKYGRGLDLAVLPEMAVTAGLSGDVVARSLPFEGSVREAFSRKARELHSYIVVPMNLLENKEKRLCSNAAILVGRNGELVGTYRKLHPAVHAGRESMEGGITPGKEMPVFDCDFGKLGIQICFDIEFDSGWREIARKGADLVAWTTQSPQTAHPAARAMQNRCYIVSSNWRNNATVFEPTGKIVSQIRAPEQLLVQEIDLSYAIVPWSPTLRNGASFKDRYGDKAGFRYYEDEDAGIFWSNDPRMTVREMVRSIPGIAEAEEEVIRLRKLFDRAGVPNY